MGMVITQNMQLRGAVCAQGDLTQHLLCVWMVLRRGAGRLRCLRSVVTEMNGICFFLFLSLRTISVVILYHCLEVTDCISLYIVYNVKGSTWVSQN